ncbi:Gfo/Idh/MocA family protein [Microlunatus speluncae]|uniref:Gfo/Idh/MocA family protein n=1 Tax=Microlunatus speluncae TaxID=2594267 RepID=UPI00126687E9|nr:Gfo/Idh/MocA family oxidoreductase [Microlunatus speluncae]
MILNQDQRIVAVGIIGAGIMGRSHAASAVGDPRVRLRAVAGVPVGTATELAETYGIERVTDDYTELLADPVIDLVIVATPDHLHAEICLAALRAGKHVLVEKPLTTSLAEADKIIALERESSSTLMVSFNHRWIPAYAQAHAEIVAGRIGRPRLAYARKNDRIHVPTTMLSWSERTTCAWFLSSHDMDLVGWFLGERPVRVYANAVSGVLRERGIDTPDAIQAQVTYAGGAVATFESCWIYPDTFPTMTDSFIEVIGERGVIQLPRVDDQLQLATTETYEYPRMSIGVDLHGRRGGAVTAAQQHLVDCILAGRAPLVDPQSSRDVIALLEALHRSLETGQPESVG